MKVCILLSTYNGEKFIVEQLDSIFGQEIKADIMLYVRDDGSKDSTVDIIKKYMRENQVNIVINEGKNCGPAGSFLEIIKKCPSADYYAFCDQDDVWHKKKLSIAVSTIGENTLPCLWCSNYDVVDSNLNIIIKQAITHPRLDDLQILFYNNIPGCTMVFNYSLLLEMRKMKISNIRMHDIMALNIALISGKVIFDSESLIQYRQHEANAIGFSHKKMNIGNWLKSKYMLIIKKEKYSIAEYAEQILNSFSECLDDTKRKEYILISKIDHSLITRFQVLNRKYVKARLGRTSISIRCRLLLGLM